MPPIFQLKIRIPLGKTTTLKIIIAGWGGRPKAGGTQVEKDARMRPALVRCGSGSIPVAAMKLAPMVVKNERDGDANQGGRANEQEQVHE